MEVIAAQELREPVDFYIRRVEVSLTPIDDLHGVSYHPAALYIDTAGGEPRARAFSCLAEIIFSAPLLSASRCELATNSRFFKMLCLVRKTRVLSFFSSWKSNTGWSWHEPS